MPQIVGRFRTFIILHYIHTRHNYWGRLVSQMDSSSRDQKRPKNRLRIHLYIIHEINYTFGSSAESQPAASRRQRDGWTDPQRHIVIKCTESTGTAEAACQCRLVTYTLRFVSYTFPVITRRLPSPRYSWRPQLRNKSTYIFQFFFFRYLWKRGKAVDQLFAHIFNSPRILLKNLFILFLSASPIRSNIKLDRRWSNPCDPRAAKKIFQSASLSEWKTDCFSGFNL